MVNFRTVAASVLLAFCFTTISLAQDVAQYLQDVSVTVRANGSEGSGNIIKRSVFLDESSNEKVDINFIWTAAHVVDGLRSTRTIIQDGQKRTVVEFKDALIIKEIVENGRKVGEINMSAKVLFYSDATQGQDLALLLVRKQAYFDCNTDFYLEEKIPAIGTNLFHVGSLRGQMGANSMTSGIMSQVGRVINLGSGEGTVFDQTTCAAFPGSSGGGVFFTDGKYVGMLVRGAGETFNLIVPVRRMKSWAEDRGIMWALDPEAKMPSLKEINAMEPEDESLDHEANSHESLESTDSIDFPTLIDKE